MSFKAFVVRELKEDSEEKSKSTFPQKIEDWNLEDLPTYKESVLIKLKYAALNYKDALSSNGHKGITRQYPHIPGVDGVGVVVESDGPQLKEGMEVIINSYDFGMNSFGAFAEYCRVPAEWVVPKPEGLSMEEAIIMGVAGFTAGLALMKMERCGQSPQMGPIVITGASGGVGSLGTAIFSQAGYKIWASTGKVSAHHYLKLLGAKRCIPRADTNDESKRPLLSPQWAGALDTVGGNTLATLLKASQKEACVATTGLVDTAQLSTTVYPFILNGVNLLGIDSAECLMPVRKAVWEKLSTDWKPKGLESIANYISLEELSSNISLILEGQTRGRVVVKF